MTAASMWQPRPDPAIHDPDRPGLRPHCHPPDRLHAWVFLHHRVWVAFWGNEYEIESMPIEYVESVIRFSEEWVERATFLITTDVPIKAGRMLLGLGRHDGSDHAKARIALKRCAAMGAGMTGLHTLPALCAFDRRLAMGKRTTDG